MTYDFEFIGGDASVDLVNTLMHLQQSGGPDELLTSGEQARAWFERAGLVTPDEAARLDPDAALQAAKRLRTALDSIYRPIARKQDDEAGSERGLSTLNAVLDQGRERVQVAKLEGKFARGTRLEILGPLDPSVRVARSAADLLHRMDPHRFKECENPECDLLFYDESRNNSRRWCSMEGCGNQQKQARFRGARSRAALPT
ncbi:CGNR zinc finger domain-containing protein [Deinococcus sp. UYEF24]